MKSKTFYHGTTWSDYQRAQLRGYLLSERRVRLGNKILLCPGGIIYLSKAPEQAMAHSKGVEVILKVNYTPSGDGKDDYEPGKWQVRVFAPISMDNVSIRQFPRGLAPGLAQLEPQEHSAD